MSVDQEKNTTETKQLPIVQLTPYEPITSTDTVCTTTGTGCSSNDKVYEDIIYIPLQKKFWLLTKQASYELGYATVSLYTNTKGILGASAEEKAKFMEKLDVSHLMKFFYNPTPASFLTEEDQKHYQELKQQNEQAELKVWEGKGKQLPDGTTPKQSSLDITGTLGISVRRQYEDYDYIYKTTKKQLEELDRKGIKIAEQQGYIVDRGELYTPEQTELRKLLAQYVKNKQQIMANEDTKKQFTTVFEKINQLQKTKQGMENVAFMYYFAPHAIADLQDEINKLDQLIKDHITIILQLATIGIATPEFALGQTSPSKEGQHIVERGMQRIFFMQAEAAKKEGIIDEMSQLFADWQFFLGNIGDAVPASAFIEKLKQLIQIDSNVQKFVDHADQLASEFVPPKILLWNPEDYKPKPNTALLKAPMALREFTRPLTFKELTTKSAAKDLYQFSIEDLAKRTVNAPNFVKKAANYAAKYPTVKKRLANLNTNHDELFEIYLNELGCKPIEIKGNTWFNNEKLFDPEAFYSSLSDKEIQVKTLENPFDRESWGKLLQYTIFQDDFLNKIMGFDPGYGAQLVRFLSKHTEQYVPFMEYAAEFTTISPSLPNFSLGGVGANLVASPYHGKMTSDTFYLPNLANALHPVISFKHHKTRDPIELDFGYFVFKLVIEGSGFVGASMALSANLALNASHGRFNVELEQPAYIGEKSRGAVVAAGGDLFVGVQAGANGTIQCKWCPPKGTKGHFWKRLELTLRQLQGDQTIAGNLNDDLDPLQETSYKTLASFALGVAGTVGIGINGAFGFTANREKIRLHLGAGLAKGIGAKGSISFELDYASAIDIVRIVLQAIRKNDNRPIGWYDDLGQATNNLPSGVDEEGKIIISESFHRFTIALLLVGRTVASLAYAWTVGISKIETLYKQMTADYGVMAAHLANSDHETELKEWFAELHPQAIGALFFHLTKDLKGNNSWRSKVYMNHSDKLTTGELIACQQIAIANCIEWLLARKKSNERDNQLYPNTAQTIFGEAVLRMNAEGTNGSLDKYYQAINPDKDKVWAEEADKANYYKNIALIRETMEREVTARNTGLSMIDEIESTKLTALQGKSKKAKDYFNGNFDKLFKSAYANSYTLNDFIEQRNTRMIALNALKGNANEQTV